jgi:DNA-binding NtrC family response regulator
MTDNTPTILLIDDDAEFSRLLGVYLKKLGVRLIYTSTMEEFAVAIKNGLPSLALVDLNLNGLTAGFALIKGLRKKFGPELPMMIISATSDAAAISHAIECGADDFIIKPIDPNLLNTKIGKYLQIAKSSQEPKLVSAPTGGIEAQFALEVSVRAVDELMLQIVSPHFLCKGAPVNIFGELVEGAFPEKKKVLGNVMNCELLLDGQYLVSLEFAELNDREKSSLRKYISSNR